MADKTPEFLTQALKFGINPGLDRIMRLCELLGHPERSFRVIHIAGTNGKGSVSAFASSMLAASGLKVGVFTSPYLERFSERIRIIDGLDGLKRYVEDDSYGEITDEALERLSAEVREAAAKAVEEGIEDPTEFELVTAICFLYFRETGIDVAVMETGLGGRLDSTNVFADPVACVVTSIGMDHMEVLGDSIGQIAREKAGIFKKGCKAFVADPDSMILSREEAAEVRNVLSEEAADKGADLLYVVPADDTIEYTGDYSMEFEVDALGSRRVHTGLLGDHQCSNCTLAAHAVMEAAKIWPSINADTCAEGIRLTNWKCRAEILCKDPLVILDGGHNPQGAESFARTYGKIAGGSLAGKPSRLVIGVMKDKDIEGIVREYKAWGMNFAEVWPVKVNNPRTAAPDELYIIINKVYNKPISRGTETDPEEAVRLAFARSQEDGMPLVITGSLYLVGQIRGVAKRLEERN